MKSMFSSTIAAVSTPHGRGGIAVIRVSGEDAVSVCAEFVKTKNGLEKEEARKALLCKIYNKGGELLDEGIVTIFRGPHSYTGEDTVEISCHGSELLCAEILETAFSCGAVPAGPGEFTRRAFSAGKLSLTEAEAVIGMIDSTSRMGLRLSRKNLDGKLSAKIKEVYDTITGVVGSVYAGIDFPDEDLETLDEDGMKKGIEKAEGMLENLEKSYKTGHAVCEGIPTVLCGKPNTGKSSILNRMAGEELAIVTDIAGTTRDVITQKIVCGNVTLNLHDTAGIRESMDSIEKIGVNRSIEEIRKSELIIAVFDASSPVTEEDRRVMDLALSCEKEGACVLCLINKTDLAVHPDMAEIEKHFKNVLRISANHPSSRETISGEINRLFVDGDILDSEEAIVTNARQHASVVKALDLCSSAKQALETLGTDIAGSELERAMSELSELDGREISADVVDNIFHKFCVGK